MKIILCWPGWKGVAVPVLRPRLPHEAAHHEPCGAAPRAVSRLHLPTLPRERAHLPGAAQAHLQAVLRIRIHMFLGLPDPDPLIRGMDPDPALDPDPDPSLIMQK